MGAQRHSLFPSANTSFQEQSGQIHTRELQAEGSELSQNSVDLNLARELSLYPFVLHAL